MTIESTNEAERIFEHLKHWADTCSIAATVATLAGWLPSFAALASLVWTCLRIYEMRTVQRWLKGRKS